MSKWIETGNGEGIRFKKRSARPEPVRIQYLVPDAPPVAASDVLRFPPVLEPVLAAGRL